MKSMTGYGRGEHAQNGCKITVEITAVNRKQSELFLNLPREVESLESAIRDEINKRVSRGRLNVRVSLHSTEGRSLEQVQLNTALAKEYAQALAILAKNLKLTEAPSLDLIARAPGVLQTADSRTDSDILWPATQKALHQAIQSLLSMREREGSHLAKDLCHRVDIMRKAVTRIQKQTPKVAKRYQQQLRARLLEAGLKENAIDEKRLLQEIVLFADRVDITEELTRMQSHFQQFDDCVKAQEPVGRTLDFLAQEMNREINTIGTKGNDGLISRDVVKLKTELEKFREQVQNVE